MHATTSYSLARLEGVQVGGGAQVVRRGDEPQRDQRQRQVRAEAQQLQRRPLCAAVLVSSLLQAVYSGGLRVRDGARTKVKETYSDELQRLPGSDTAANMLLHVSSFKELLRARFHLALCILCASELMRFHAL